MTRFASKEQQLAVQEALLREQDGLCALCGRPMAEDDMTFDHIVPRSMGGTAHFANLRLAHKLCNQLRGDTFDKSDRRALERTGRLPSHVTRPVWRTGQLPRRGGA